MDLRRKFKTTTCSHSFTIYTVPKDSDKNNEVWEKCSKCGIIRIGEIIFKRYFDPQQSLNFK